MKKTFVIAEIGINHSGKLLNALKLIDAAKEAGADAVKFQKRTIDRVYGKEELDKPREHPLSDDQTNKGQKLALEFGKEEYDAIDEHCKAIGIDWFASAWDLESQKFLQGYNLKYNKVASALLTHLDLLRSVASEGKHTFISVGMSTLEEIYQAVEIFKDVGCPYSLMHCNSQYPMPDEQANLKCIRTLGHYFNCDVGYSSHSSGIIIPVLSVMLGATCIEAHLTLDRSSYGSDQAASLEPHGFKKMIDYIRVAEIALGDGIKTISEAEKKCAAKLRRTCDY